MSADAAARLRADALARLAPLAGPVRHLADLQRDLREAEGDYTETCQDVLRAVLAVEAAEDAAKAAREALRALLTDALDMGPGIVRTDTHTASVGKGRRAVVITGDVPPEWLVQPPPRPDKERIREALERSEALAFATLAGGNGEPLLTIRARRD